jgi:hypothetical protein
MRGRSERLELSFLCSQFGKSEFLSGDNATTLTFHVILSCTVQSYDITNRSCKICGQYLGDEEPQCVHNEGVTIRSNSISRE